MTCTFRRGRKSTVSGTRERPTIHEFADGRRRSASRRLQHLRPQITRVRLPGSVGRRSGLRGRDGRLFRRDQYGEAEYPAKLRLLESDGRLRSQPDPHPLFGTVDLWTGLLGGASEYASGGLPRGDFRDDHRVRHRGSEAFAELDRLETRNGLCRTVSQHPAAAPVGVLVQGRPADSAQPAPIRLGAGRRLPQQSRPRDPEPRLPGRRVHRRLGPARRLRAGLRVPHLCSQAPGRHGPAASRSVGLARAHRRPTVAGLCRPRAADRFRIATTQGFQLRRRQAGLP